MMDTGVGVSGGWGACHVPAYELARYVDQDPPGYPAILVLRI